MTSVQRADPAVKAPPPAAEPERVYVGMRSPAGAPVVMVSGGYGGGFLRHVKCHSRQFDWGYHGAGAADLALSLLADALGEHLPSPTTPAEGPQRAWRHYQGFKIDHVAHWPRSGDWRITRSEILAWAAERERPEQRPVRWQRLLGEAAAVAVMLGLFVYAAGQVALWFAAQLAAAGVGR